MTNPRAEILSKAPLDALQQTMQAAQRSGNTRLFRDCEDAIAMTRGERFAAKGELVEIVEQPSRENGWRHGVTRYEGDPMVWMAPLMSVGTVFKIDSDMVMAARREENVAVRAVASRKG